MLTPNTSSRAGYIAFNSTVATPNAFIANYDVFVGGGNGGDGISFNYGNLNTSGSLGGAESGMVNSGLAIGFSDYSNKITIYYNKTALQSYNVNLNAGAYKSVAITVTYDGQLTLVYGGTTICSNYQLPAAYATDNKSSWQYALAARCGASNNYHSVKNVVIKDNSIQYTINGTNYTENPNFTNVVPSTYNVRARISNGAYCSAVSSLGSVTITPPPGMVAITGQPSTTNQSVAQNATATTLTVTATGAATISYQWLSNTVAYNNGGNPIIGATSASYTPPTSATGTLYYYCSLSNACSEVNSAISGSVTTYLPAPNISYTTPNTFIVGTLISPLTPTNTGGNPVGVSNVVSTLAGSGSAGSADGIGTAASFKTPTGIAVDNSGNIYVADNGNNKIRKITPAGVVNTLAGSGSVGSNNGTSSSASFNGPYSVAVDNSFNVFVADYQNYKIRQVNSAGDVTTFAGSGNQVSIDGTGTNASFNYPSGIAQDNAGNKYVTDVVGHKIRKITPSGVVTTFAGSGSYGFADGTATAAKFYWPTGIVVDAMGYVYVADYGNNRIRKITPAGEVTTLAGSGSAGSDNGTGLSASFNHPKSLALDGAGNLYVADMSNNYIRKVTPSGVVTTFAGNGATGSTDGVLASASFYEPNGVAVDGTGNIYVADMGNNKIRKIASSGGYTITPALPAGLIMDGFNINIKVNAACTPTISSNSTNICSSALPYSWNGLTFNAAGTQTKTGLTNAAGCDSSATLTVTVKAVTSSSSSIAICSSALPYSWNGLTFNAAGTQTKTGFTNAAGCDSSATLTITVKAVTSSSNSIAICSSALPYSWNGLTFNAAGTQTKTGFTNAAGCDSSATLTVTVKAVTSSSNSIAICSSALPYSWNGLTFTAAGTQTKTGFTNAAGCDSSATLTVTVKAVTSSSNSIAICPSALPYSWNGLTFNAAGTQTKTGFTNAAGCDSSATLTVTVKTNYTITATPKGNGTISNSGVSTICEGDNTAAYIIVANSGYSIAGVWVDGINQGAISTYTFNNVTAHHTIVAIFVSNCLPTTSTTNATVCANALPYSWNSNSYNAAGSYIVHFTNAKGCDSAATLNLTVTNNPSSGQLYSKYGYTNNITLCTLESFSVYPDVKGGVWSSADSNIVSTIKQPGSTSSIVFKPQNAGTVKVNYITSNT
ncbi:MAG: NHL repeat-containing protein, partial [Candidatus Saccharibacteria bacterium]|nr:NHL repeat-containing protein [Candidatus Saccharibacteria bacterium]